MLDHPLSPSSSSSLSRLFHSLLLSRSPSLSLSPSFPLSLQAFSLRSLRAEENSLVHRTHQRSLIKISILIVRRLPSRADVLAGVRFHAHGARCRSSTGTNPYISPVNVVPNDATICSFRFRVSRWNVLDELVETMTRENLSYFVKINKRTGN